MQQRDTAASFADHDVDGAFVQFVAFAQFLRIGWLAVRLLDFHVDQFVHKILFARTDGGDHGVDFVVTQVGTLAAEQRAGAGPEEQHVAVAEQFIGPHFIEYDAAVDPAGDLERDAGRQVGLDQAGDDIDRRFLRGEDQVDTDRPALLCQANDMLFHLFAGGHHQVGDFVRHDDDERQVVGDGGCLLLVLGL